MPTLVTTPVFVFDMRVSGIQNLNFYPPEKLTKPYAFLQITNNLMERVAIPSPGSPAYILVHDGLQAQYVIPIPEDIMNEMKNIAFTQLMVKRAIHKPHHNRKRKRHSVLKKSNLGNTKI
jgi:hypothetical protein